MLALPPWPAYAEDEVEASARVLRSGRVNQWTGDDVAEFEAAACRTLGVRHAAALANGTLALELMLAAVGIGSGDEVVVPARTFIATAAACALRGARPVVADVDPESGCMTATTAEAALTARTRAVLPVHLGGWPCPLDELDDLCKDKSLLLLEDCAQAHGAAWKDRNVGTWGTAAAWSFCQDKIISTAGEGGMVTTDEEQVHQAVWSARDHGKDPDAVARSHPPGFRWLHADFGTNARMTGPQAAVGTIQLAKLSTWAKIRRRNAAHLRARLREVPGLRVPEPPPVAQEVPYRVYAFAEGRWKSGWDHGRLVAALAEAGVPGGVGSCGEIYREEAFRLRGWGLPQRLPNAARLADSSLAFPVHPGMEPHHVELLAEAVATAARQAMT